MPTTNVQRSQMVISQVFYKVSQQTHINWYRMVFQSHSCPTRKPSYKKSFRNPSKIGSHKKNVKTKQITTKNCKKASFPFKLSNVSQHVLTTFKIYFVCPLDGRFCVCWPGEILLENQSWYFQRHWFYFLRKVELRGR